MTAGFYTMTAESYTMTAGLYTMTTESYLMIAFDEFPGMSRSVLHNDRCVLMTAVSYTMTAPS